MKQGTKANFNGKTFEDSIELIIHQQIDDVLFHKDLTDDFNKSSYLLKNVPYKSIYNKLDPDSTKKRKSSSEFVLVHNNIKVRIEAKWQSSPGSVDEKFPYVLLNCLFAYDELINIIILDGGGYKHTAKLWISKAAEFATTFANTFTNSKKQIFVLSLNEFGKWFDEFMKEDEDE